MRQKIVFLLLCVFAASVLFIAACSGGSTGNQTTTNARANAGASPLMVSNQIANTPAAVGSNANAIANAANVR